MKKLFATAILTAALAACGGKAKDAETTPDMGNEGGDATGGDTYGADAYGAAMDAYGGAAADMANPCGGM